MTGLGGDLFESNLEKLHCIFSEETVNITESKIHVPIFKQ